jgi:hypothetical protein
MPSADPLRAFLPPDTAETWQTIAPLVPPVAYLGGGTAIAVHLEHRTSRDLDFFFHERLPATGGRPGHPTGPLRTQRSPFLDATGQRGSGVRSRSSSVPAGTGSRPRHTGQHVDASNLRARQRLWQCEVPAATAQPPADLLDVECHEFLRDRCDPPASSERRRIQKGVRLNLKTETPADSE